MRKHNAKCIVPSLCAVVILSLLLPLFAGALQVKAAGRFQDVDPDKYYAAAVEWAVANDITAGTSDTTFSPDKGCTRGQVVTFLYKASKGKPSGENNFTDVKQGAYYYDAVLWAVSYKITSGTTETTFSPGQMCTRAQVVTFLWRLHGSPITPVTKEFSDVQPAAYYYNAVNWAVSKGITSGVDTDTFGVNNVCTRGQIATFLYKSYKHFSFEEEETQKQPARMINLVDCLGMTKEQILAMFPGAQMHHYGNPSEGDGDIQYRNGDYTIYFDDGYLLEGNRNNVYQSTRYIIMQAEDTYVENNKEGDLPVVESFDGVKTHNGFRSVREQLERNGWEYLDAALANEYIRWRFHKGDLYLYVDSHQVYDLIYWTDPPVYDLGNYENSYISQIPFDNDVIIDYITLSDHSLNGWDFVG